MSVRFGVVVAACILAAWVMVEAASAGIGGPVVAQVDLNDREHFDRFQTMNVQPFFRFGNIFLVEVTGRELLQIRRAGIPAEQVDEQPFSGRYYVGTAEAIVSKKVPAATTLEQLSDLGGYTLYKSKTPINRAEYRRSGFELVELKKREIPLVYQPVLTGNPFFRPASASGVLDTLLAKVSQDSMYAYDTRLEAFRSRLALSDSSVKARDWIKQKFESFGYTNVSLDEFWLDDNLYGQPGYTWNIVCVKPGTTEPDRYIVVGGHWDSYIADGTDPYVFCPGADDDASGTAGTLEIARILANVPTRKTFIFIAFGAEEPWMIGSYHYAAEAYSAGMDIELMLNMDMIGHDPDNHGSILCAYYSISQLYGELMASLGLQYTNLVPSLAANVASDHWAFDQWGYPGIMAIEGEFNTVGYHTALDISSRLNFTFMTNVTKMVLATGYMVNMFPAVVSDAIARDLGDGQSLFVQWTPIDTPDIAGYRVYWGTSSEIYPNQRFIPGSGSGNATIDGLADGQKYYLTVVAVDTAGSESFLRPEFTGVPRLVPLPPTGVAAATEEWRVELAWRPNQEMDFDHYRIYRKVAPGGYTLLMDNQMPTFYTDTDVQAGVMYDYVITAVDQTGHESAHSDTVTAAAATFDQGILIVDNTPPGYGNPTPEQKQAFFAAAFEGLPTSYYYFDAATHDLNKSVIGQYNAVFWFDDGNAAGLWDPGDLAKLRWYLDHNTGLMLGGWRTAFEFAGLNSSAPITAGNFLHDYAGVNFIRENYDVDFRGAHGDYEFPDVVLDSLKVYEFWNGLMGWTGNFTTDGTGEIIYRFDSYTGANEGLPVGVRRENETSKFAFLSMPLLYLRDADGQAMIHEFTDWFSLGPTCDCSHIGDCSGDGLINALDIVYMVNYVLRMTGGPPPTDAKCPVINRGDWDCTARVDIADVVKMVNYVYRYPALGPCNPCGQ